MKKGNDDRVQFLKFLFTGGLNTIFSYSVYTLLIFFHIPLLIAGVLQSFFGMLFSFRTLGLFVFKNSSNKLISKFIFGYIFLSGFYIFGLRAAHIFIANEYICGAIVLIPYVLISYVINRTFIFKSDN